MNISANASKDENLAFCVERFHFLFPRNQISAVFEYDKEHYLFCDLPCWRYPGKRIFGACIVLVDKDGMNFRVCNPILDKRVSDVMEKEILYKDN